MGDKEQLFPLHHHRHLLLHSFQGSKDHFSLSAKTRRRSERRHNNKAIRRVAIVLSQKIKASKTKVSENKAGSFASCCIFYSPPLRSFSVPWCQRKPFLSWVVQDAAQKRGVHQPTWFVPILDKISKPEGTKKPSAIAAFFHLSWAEKSSDL